MTLSARWSAILRPTAIRWPWPSERKPLVIEHVRYTKRPSPDPIEKARQMCIAMGREIPEALR